MTKGSPVPDLHGWITQHIDHTQAVATTATPGPWHVFEYNWQTDFDAGIGTTPGSVDIVGHGYEGGGVERTEDAEHITLHSPAAVLRRCEADRRILNRHRLNPDAYWTDAAACHGCGVMGDCDDPVTDNLNDCPELLDLGYAHGLTPELLATLDRPQKGERPEPRAFRTGPPTRPATSVPAALRGPNWPAP